MSFSPIIPLLACAGAALYTWLSGRKLLGRVDDPLFPELHLARTNRLVLAWIIANPLVILTDGPHELWGLPLLAVALLAGGYSYRRALFSERWSLVAYLRYSLSSAIGSFGFWAVVALTPMMVLGIAKWAPADARIATAAVIGAAIAVGLLIWEPNFPAVWVALHRGTPLDRDDLRPHFDAVVRHARIPAPPTFRYGVPGGYVMNAVALPSTRQSYVAIGDSLLEVLAPDEIAAIFAHEIAHLEHYRGNVLRRARIAVWLIVVVAAALPAILLAGAPGVASIIAPTWAFALVIGFAARAARNKTHESECDRRAATMMGDPEPVIRALTKLHHFMRMPRRWAYDFERTASHPSLASRIQALRQDAASPPASLETPAVLRSTTPGVFIALDSSRMYQFDGVPASVTSSPATATPHAASADSAHDSPPSIATLRDAAGSYRAVVYSDLTELRVAAAGTARVLRVRDRTGKRWAVPLEPRDVGAAQRALDTLDGRLSTTAGTPWRVKARVAAAGFAIFGVAFLGWIWIPLLITLMWPSVAALAAMAAMGVARLAFAFVTGAGSLPASVMAALWAPAVGWACWLSWRWSRSADDRGSGRPIAVALIACSVIVGAALASAGAPTAEALFAEPSLVSLIVLAVGGGTALLTFRDRARRVVGATLTTLAVATGSLALVTVQRVGIDPQRFDWTDVTAETLGGFPVTGYPRRLALSGDGTRAFVQEYSVGDPDAEYGDGTRPSRFTIGTAAGADTSVEAFDIAFLDRGSLLILRDQPTPPAASADSMELVVHHASGRTDSWRRTLPQLAMPTLTVDAATGGWAVVGYDTRAGGTYQLVMHAGTVGSDRLATRTLPRDMMSIQPLLREADETLVAATARATYNPPATVFRALGMASIEWDFWRLDGDERQFVGALPGYPKCAGGAASLLCVVTARRGFSLWRIDPSGAAPPLALGTLPTASDVWRPMGSDTLAAVSAYGDELAVADVALARGIRVTLPIVGVDSSSHVIDVATRPTVAVVVMRRAGGSSVTFYRIRTAARSVTAAPVAPDR